MFNFYLLIVTLLFSWFARTRQLAPISFSLLLLCGLSSGTFEVAALPAMVLLALVLSAMKKENLSWSLRIGSAALALGIYFLMNFHMIPGFNNFLVFEGRSLSPSAYPFSMYLNFDKPLFALFFLALYGSTITERAKLSHILKVVVYCWAVAIVIVGALGYSLNHIAFDFKIPEGTALFAINNLMLVSISEEVFFRGFLQKDLDDHLSRHLRGGSYIALILTAILFGLSHIKAGWTVVMLTGIAGVIYGFAFQKTKSLEAPLLTHFVFNLTHFLFFTYPALAH